jgi:SAM-dependent methyltransferase
MKVAAAGATQDIEDRDRKLEEANFHNFLRGEQLARDPKQLAYYRSNRRFYTVTRSSNAYLEDWLRRRARGKKFLDYGCGDGATSFMLAEAGAHTVGVDISAVSVENCRREAERRGLQDRCSFAVMDAENLSFLDNEFDYAIVLGVFHHLHFERALETLRRVIKPTGPVISLEAFGHNPLFMLYRRRTPHLRTRWETEHLLRRPDLDRAGHYFSQLEVRPFHLFTLLAVPFHCTRVFFPLLRILEAVDSWILRLPVVRWHAWMLCFVLTNPRKL